jgi:hypothetical protein
VDSNGKTRIDEPMNETMDVVETFATAQGMVIEGETTEIGIVTEIVTEIGIDLGIETSIGVGTPEDQNGYDHLAETIETLVIKRKAKRTRPANLHQLPLPGAKK